MEIKIESTVKGTRIIYGQEALRKRQMINYMIEQCLNQGFNEIMFPVMQFQETFSDKVGNENQKMMYNFQDQGGRNLCLAPEYTAIIMQLAKTTFKIEKDVKLFYVVECFRGEKPQAGRYREFTQFGVEIINPSQDYSTYMETLAAHLIDDFCNAEFEINSEATRGLDYYVEGKGFEITCPMLGAQKQIVGGGAYPGGIGFAIGLDRLLLTKFKNEEQS